MSAVIHLADFHISNLQMDFLELSTNGESVSAWCKLGFDYTVSQKRDHPLIYRMKLAHHYQEVDANDKPAGCNLKVGIVASSSSRRKPVRRSVPSSSD